MKNDKDLEINNELPKELNNETNLNDLEPSRSTRTKKTTSTKPAMSDQERKIVGFYNRGFDINRICAQLGIHSGTVKETIEKFS